VVLPLREGVTPVGDLRNFCFRGEGVIVKPEHSSSFPFRNVSVPRRARYILGRFGSGHVRHRGGGGACSPYSASHCQLHTLCTQHAFSDSFVSVHLQVAQIPGIDGSRYVGNNISKQGEISFSMELEQEVRSGSFHASKKQGI